jgi:hypothetical protein
MTEDKAKQTGSRQALKSVAVGLSIAQVMMTYMSSLDQGVIQAFFWFTTIDYKLNIFVGALIMLPCGHLFGQIAGKAILIRKYNFIITGILCGITVLFTAAFSSGWTGFFLEGIENMGADENPFKDYILKPFYLVSLFGIIPAILVGIWFGWKIKKHDA